MGRRTTHRRGQCVAVVVRGAQALGDVALISSTPAGYAWPWNHRCGGVRAVGRLGRRALAAGDPGRALTQLSAAQELWRGPALADIPDAPSPPRPRAGWRRARLASARTDRGRARARPARRAGCRAAALVAAHPLRERASRQYVTALYRAGRQAEALTSYEEARERLAEEAWASHRTAAAGHSCRGAARELAAIHRAAGHRDHESARPS